jgi:hypothetical protein
MEIGLVSEMLVCLNHMLWLLAQKDVTEHCISTCQKTGNEKLSVLINEMLSFLADER